MPIIIGLGHRRHGEPCDCCVKLLDPDVGRPQSMAPIVKAGEEMVKGIGHKLKFIHFFVRICREIRRLAPVSLTDRLLTVCIVPLSFWARNAASKAGPIGGFASGVAPSELVRSNSPK